MSEYQDNPGPLLVLEMMNKDEGGEGLLSNGSKGKIVEQLQKMLIDSGYDLGYSGADGKFGDYTEKAVKRFQNEHKDWEGKQLKGNGLVCQRTADALNRAVVGKWYPKYETPKGITKDTLHVIATKDSLKNGISLDTKDVKMAKVILSVSAVKGTHIDLRRVYFAIYYNVLDNAFKRAAETWQKTIMNSNSYSENSDIIILEEVETEADFKMAWKRILKKALQQGEK